MGPMLLQVSEIGKLGLLFALAHYLAVNRRDFDDVLRGYIIPCGIVAVFCGFGAGCNAEGARVAVFK